jgi:hypothetical protein
MVALAIDAADSQTLYAVLRVETSDALYTSIDGGREWRKSTDLAGGGQAVYVDPRSPAKDRTLFVMGSRSVAIRERGQWSGGQELSEPGAAARRRAPARFAAGFPPGGGPPVVYAITGATAFVSEDGGRPWRPIAFPAPSPRLGGIGTSLGRPDVVYLSYNYREPDGKRVFGVARSADRGRTWSSPEGIQPGARSEHLRRMASRALRSWLGRQPIRPRRRTI